MPKQNSNRVSCDTEYIIDGTNVLYCGKQYPSLDRIIALTDQFRRESIPFQVVFDANTPYQHIKTERERKTYEKLLRDDPHHFSHAPAGNKADDFILQYTETNPDCTIITQDLYRDYRDRFGKARTKVIRVMDLNGSLLLPAINMTVKLNNEKNN